MRTVCIANPDLLSPGTSRFESDLLAVRGIARILLGKIGGRKAERSRRLPGVGLDGDPPQVNRLLDPRKCEPRSHSGDRRTGCALRKPQPLRLSPVRWDPP